MNKEEKIYDAIFNTYKNKERNILFLFNIVLWTLIAGIVTFIDDYRYLKFTAVVSIILYLMSSLINKGE